MPLLPLVGSTWVPSPALPHTCPTAHLPYCSPAPPLTCPTAHLPHRSPAPPCLPLIQMASRVRAPPKPLLVQPTLPVRPRHSRQASRRAQPGRSRRSVGWVGDGAGAIDDVGAQADGGYVGVYDFLADHRLSLTSWQRNSTQNNKIHHAMISSFASARLLIPSSPHPLIPSSPHLLVSSSPRPLIPSSPRLLIPSSPDRLITSQVSEYPNEGLFVHGLYVEGARWPKKEELEPKAMKAYLGNSK